MSSEHGSLTTAQVEDGFAYNEWDVDPQEEEAPRRERFRRWHAEEIRKAKAEALRENGSGSEPRASRTETTMTSEPMQRLQQEAQERYPVEALAPTYAQRKAHIAAKTISPEQLEHLAKVIQRECIDDQWENLSAYVQQRYRDIARTGLEAVGCVIDD